MFFTQIVHLVTGSVPEPLSSSPQGVQEEAFDLLSKFIFGLVTTTEEIATTMTVKIVAMSAPIKNYCIGLPNLVYD